MRILGISAFHHDAAAALVVDGVPIAAMQEERYTRRPFDSSFPKWSVRACLRAGGLRAADLDQVVFYEKPLRKFERCLATQLQSFPRSSGVFYKSMYLWLGDRLWMKNRIADELEVDTDRIVFTEHHEALAANAFFTSPFEEAAVLIAGGVGEWATTSLARCSGSDVEILAEVRFPHSLGLFASAVTQYLGFEPGRDEELVLSLAARGQPRFAGAFAELVQATEDQGFTVDQSRFRFAFDSERLFGQGLEELLGPARSPRADPTALPDAHAADVAHGLRAVLEARMTALALELARRAPSENLCLTGDLARLRRLNAAIFASGAFRRLHVPPAPAEAGAALGAALLVAARSGGGRPRAHPACALGEAVVPASDEGGRVLASEAEAVPLLLERIEAGGVVGLARGRMELGHHSRGGRVLLGDARAEATCRRVRRIRLSEDFAPLSLVVPAERAAELFELPPGTASALATGMLAVRAKDRARAALSFALDPDGTACVLCVSAEEAPVLHALLTAFGQRTGLPVLLCETLDQRGLPMVRTEADALDLLRRMELDAVLVNDRFHARVAPEKKTGEPQLALAGVSR
jgi:carbamoyltransferase